MKKAFSLAPPFKALGLPVLALLAAACAPLAVVFLSPSYRPAAVKKVAIIAFRDFPSMAGSGQIVEGIFGNLLLNDYTVVSSSQVNSALQHLSLQASDELSLDSLHSLAAALGVDAFVFGQVTDFTDASVETVVEDVPVEQDLPVYSPVETTGRDGQPRVSDMVTGTDMNFVDQPEDETVSVPAHVGLSVHMVDAKTGEILWSASDSDYGDYLNDASQAAAVGIMNALQPRLKKAS